VNRHPEYRETRKPQVEGLLNFATAGIVVFPTEKHQCRG
jgi:hypothetical protein